MRRYCHPRWGGQFLNPLTPYSAISPISLGLSLIAEKSPSLNEVHNTISRQTGDVRGKDSEDLTEIDLIALFA